MPILLFKSNYLDLIRRGKKTTTLRRTHRLRENQIATFLSGKEKINVHIDKITPIKLKDVTSDIAKSDGFKSKKDLVQTLKSIYKDMNTSQLYLIEFTPL